MFAWVRKQKNKKGFTLLELIVVMAVLAILVAMGVPRFLGYTKDAKVTALKADIEIIERACMQYALMSDTGEDWPVKMVGEPGEPGEPVEYDATGTDLAAALPGVTLYEIDEEAVSEFIRSTSNLIEEFVLVVDGEHEGEVFHKTGVEDKDSVTWFGIDLNDDDDDE